MLPKGYSHEIAIPKPAFLRAGPRFKLEQYFGVHKYSTISPQILCDNTLKEISHKSIS